MFFNKLHNTILTLMFAASLWETCESNNYDQSTSLPPSQCKLMCSIPVSNPTFFYIHQQILPVFTSGCHVTGSASQDICSIDMSDLTGLFLTSDMHESTHAIHYTQLVCPTIGMRVSFTNQNNTQIKTFVTYLVLQGCDTLWEDINTFGNAVDLRVLYLLSWTNLREETFLNATSPTVLQNDTLDTVPSGLVNVGTLFLHPRHPQPFPRILTSYIWPRMAEIELVRFSCEDFGRFQEQLRYSMPLLQTLDIQQSRLVAPSLSFPWNMDDLDLPLNLTRSPVFNSQYSNELGFEVESNIYRRCLFFTNNSLEDLSSLTLRGRLSLVTLAWNQISVIPVGTFHGIEYLQALDLSHNNIQTLPLNVFHGLSDILVVDMSFNRIELLPNGLFEHQSKLTRLDLSQNRIQSITDGMFVPLLSLSYLDLSYNRISNISDSAIFQDQDKVESILLNNNNLTQTPTFVYILRNLKYTDMSNNNVTFQSFINNFISLGHNHVISQNVQSNTRLMPRLLPLVYKSINLINNSINTLPIDELDKYNKWMLIILFSFHNFIFDNNGMNCNCRMFNFFRSLKEIESLDDSLGSVQYNDFYERSLRCEFPAEVNHKLLSQISNKTFKCEVEGIENCPPECKCFNRTLDGAILVDCSSRELTTLPDVVPEGTKEMYIQNNRIETINMRPSYLRDIRNIKLNNNSIETVSEGFLQALSGPHTELHLQDNKISTISKDITTLHFKTIDISGNPWICDCHALWMKDWLIKDRNQIADLDGVVCATGSAQGKLIVDANEKYFVCVVPAAIVIRNALLIAGGVIAFVFIICVVIYKYRGEIKILLYVRCNWHPFDRSEDADLLDCIYDAFVSYCSADYRWVCFELLKRLEVHDPPWRACVHDRDFVAGNFVEENILDSVKTSRRMIIVLTESYLLSDWCMMEFRTAHRRVLKDKTNYIILIVADDVTIADLDDDLKLYMRTNTYISVSNKWFWENLYYSMPHKPLSILHHELNQSVPSRGQPLSAWKHKTPRIYALSGEDERCDSADSGVELNAAKCHISVHNAHSQYSSPTLEASYL